MVRETTVVHSLAKLTCTALGLWIVAAGDTAAQVSCDLWNSREFFESAVEGDVSRCLQAGADVNEWDFNRGGLTPLHHAARGSAVDVVTALLDAGAEIEVRNAINSDASTPLHYAVSHNTPAVVRILLDAGADVQAEHGFHGATPLHFAAERGDDHALEVVTVLLEAGADVRAQTWAESTPLHYAATSGLPAVAMALLNAGASSAVEDMDGRVPWHYAAKRASVFEGTEVLWQLAGVERICVENAQHALELLKFLVSPDEKRKVPPNPDQTFDWLLSNFNPLLTALAEHQTAAERVIAVCAER